MDFKGINARRKQINPTADDIIPAHLINNILIARGDTILAARYGGEFYTSALTSEIIRLRYRELLKRIGIEREEIENFKEIIIPDSPSVRNAINSDARTFKEFLSLLDKSQTQKFRDWIQGVNPDDKLVTAYFKEVTSDSWLNTLPTKTFRYILCSIIGIINTVAGLTLSAADSFLTEKILGGWRPNHFVEHQLKLFLDTPE